MAAPPPPAEAPPPSPPAAPPTGTSALDLDLDFIAFDKPAPVPAAAHVAGPSRASSSSTPLGARNGRAAAAFPASLPSRPGTPAGKGRSSSGKGKNKRSNDEVDYGREGEGDDGAGGEEDMDFDRELDIDPRDNVSMRRLRARGIPWTRSMEWARCRTVQDMLNDEALAFWHYIRPTQIEHNVRGYVIDLITACVHRAYHDAKVHVFGSYRTGLYLPYGDIDLVVESPSLSSRSNKNQIHQLAALLRRDGIAHSVQAILGAKIPIVKFRTVSGDFAVDISVGQLNGVQSGHIIRDYFRAIPAMQPLIYLVKHFLWQRSLNEVFTGGLGSYATICLVISFLQMHPKLRRNEIDPMKNLGVLLMEFFELYGGIFDSERTGISLREGGNYFHKHSRGWEAKDQHNREQREKFSIEDPQDPSNDISRGSFSMRKIKGAFNGAFTRLTARLATVYEEHQNMLARMRNPNDPILMSTPHPWTDHRGQMVHEKITILGCVLGLDDETISHRHRIGNLYKRGDLQDQLGVPQNAKPSFFKHLGEAAWVSELVADTPGKPEPTTSTPSASSAPPSAVSGVRSVTAIMLEDEGAAHDSGGVDGQGESYEVDSDSDSMGGRTSRGAPITPARPSRKQRERERKDQRAEARAAKAQRRTSSNADDAETSKYAISRPAKRARGTAEAPLELSDSDSIEMDLDVDESEEEGQVVGPEEYARSRGRNNPKPKPPSKKRSRSPPPKPRNGDKAKLNGPAPNKAVYRSSHDNGSNDSRSTVSEKRSGDRNGSAGTSKKVRTNERAAYWASKGGVAADEADPPAMTLSIKGRTKRARSQTSQGNGGEAFADLADFIAL